MKYELKANQGIPASLLIMLSIATGLSVANCYYNQPLLGSIATDFKINDLSANAVATLTQVGYMLGLLFVIPLGDLFSRRKLILTNYVLAACSLLAIGTAQDIRIVWVASLITGATSVMPQFFIPLVSYHSAPSHKTRNVGIMQSCLLVGVLGSRILSGLIANAWGWRMVYFIAAGLMTYCWLMMYKVLPALPAQAKETYGRLMKSLWHILRKYPYLRIASARAALAYGAFFALWSCLAFKMKQAPFFAGDDIIGALGFCGLAGAATVVFISKYISVYGARRFSLMGGAVMLVAWLTAWWGGDSYAGIIIAILLIDAGMQSIHLANQTSVVTLDAEAINRVNTLYMTIYFLGGSVGTFVAGICWEHFQWTGTAIAGLTFIALSLLVSFTFKESKI